MGLSGALRGDASILHPAWFGDRRRLERLRKAAAARRDTSVPFMASSGIEAWTPTWVGEDLPRTQRKSLLQKREKNAHPNLAELLSNAACFWLSHYAVGSCSIAGALAHILVLIRIADERSTNTQHLIVNYNS